MRREAKLSLNFSLGFPEFNLKMDKPYVQTIYEFGEFRLDAECLMLYRNLEEIPLAPKAAETLRALIERRGEIVAKDELITILWPDAFVEESNLFYYLHILRKTLGNRENGNPYIETYRRRGYRFNGDVQILQRSTDGHYAWIVDKPDEDGSNIMTQSGRMYILKDSGPDMPASQRIEAMPNPQPFETGDLPTAEPELLSPVNRGSHRLPGRKALITASLLAAVVLSVAFAVYWSRSSMEGEVGSGGELTVLRLTNGLAPIDATISPDGKYFVYHELENNVYRMWLQQTGFSARIEMIPPSEQPIFAKSFSPDGRYVYFLSAEARDARFSLYRVPTLGGTVTKILTGIDSQPSFSPDGREMVYYRFDAETKRGIYIVRSSDGSGEERVLQSLVEPAYHFGNAAWSPDGKIIACATNNFTADNP
ncbi:MAG TPA: hypothetical protein DEA22_01780, partial [Blastocatellia bacterium]|nr:hypothetical protein [Blastocatellia bacterium]